MKLEKDKIYVFTDGACKGNPGPGGWGVYLRFNNEEKELYGGEKNTTNNKMELTAVIEGLNSIKDKTRPVIIITDSSYVKNGIESWIHNWKKNGWKSASKKPVKNQELWQKLDRLTKEFKNLKWQWIKGHSGNTGNEKADMLANLGVNKILNQ